MPTPLACPACRDPLTPLAALEAGSVAWPNQGWVWFTCPKCGENAHLRMHDGWLGIGTLDGAPGPCWIQLGAAGVPDLAVERVRDGLDVRLGERRFRFRARGRD